ncbi:MAG: CCXG family PEP-CTERM protein [Nitrosomonas sp.]|nr:MAG: CCXG family PEP-CTERM protein [Nitrosomonas sp.]
MRNTLKYATVIMSFMFFSSVEASTIKIETGYSSAGSQVNADAYQSTVNAAVASPTSGYGSSLVTIYDNISNHSLFPGGSYTDIAFKSTIDFHVSASNAGLWNFRAGVDFGHGGAMFIDDVAYDFKTNDMWWNGSYSNSSQILSVSGLNLTAGNHTLNLYGFEGCCDGYQQVQFSYGNNEFTTFASNDTLSAVPEPETYVMMLFGMILIGLSTINIKRYL